MADRRRTPPLTGRERVGLVVAVLAWCALLVVVVIGVRNEAQAVRDVAEGGGVAGRVRLDAREERTGFRAPTTWHWEGTFTGEDGVVRVVRVEGLPGDVDTRRSGGGWAVDDVVPARWSPRTPDVAYHDAGDPGRYWGVGATYVGGLVAIGAVALLVWLAGRRPRDPLPSPGPAAPIPAAPTEREVVARRRAAGDAEQARLQDRLDRLRRDRPDGA